MTVPGPQDSVHGAESLNSQHINGRSIAIAGKLNCAVLSDLFDRGQMSADLTVGYQESPKISYLVRPLLDMGLHLHLVTLANDVTHPFRLHGPGVVLSVCPSRRGDRGRDAYSKERRLVRDAILSEPVDMVHAHHTYEYALGALAAKLPTLITVRDWAPSVARLEAPGSGSVKRSAHLAVKVGMQIGTLLRGEHFTANSPYLGKRIGTFARKHAAVVPNCLPPGMLSDEPRQLNKSTPSIVSINRGFGRLKNVSTLLEAFPSVRNELPAARLVLVGPGYGPDEAAESWARARGLDDGVEFLGRLPHERVTALLDDADLMVHPSREESFGIVLIEAMARGTPVVGGIASGAVPWVLNDGKAGVLTDISDPGGVAREVCDVLSNSARWQELSRAGRQHVGSKFTAEAVAAQYGAEYSRILAGGTV